MKLYLIEVKPEHRPGRGRWWRPNAAGYTSLLENAGLYTAAEAMERSGHSDRYSAVPVDESLLPLFMERRAAHHKRIEESARAVEHLEEMLLAGGILVFDAEV